MRGPCIEIACLFFFFVCFFPPTALFKFKHSSFMPADTLVLVQACPLSLPPLCKVPSLTGRSIKKCQLSRSAKPKRLSGSSAASPLHVLYVWQACVCARVRACVCMSLHRRRSKPQTASPSSIYFTLYVTFPATLSQLPLTGELI